MRGRICWVLMPVVAKKYALRLGCTVVGDVNFDKEEKYNQKLCAHYAPMQIWRRPDFIFFLSFFFE